MIIFATTILYAVIFWIIPPVLSLVWLAAAIRSIGHNWREYQEQNQRRLDAESREGAETRYPGGMRIGVPLPYRPSWRSLVVGFVGDTVAKLGGALLWPIVLIVSLATGAGPYLPYLLGGLYSLACGMVGVLWGVVLAVTKASSMFKGQSDATGAGCGSIVLILLASLILLGVTSWQLAQLLALYR